MQVVRPISEQSSGIIRISIELSSLIFGRVAWGKLAKLRWMGSGNLGRAHKSLISGIKIFF